MTAESHQPTAPRSASEATHEFQTTDLPTGRILLCVAALLALLLLGLAFAGGLFAFLDWQRQPIGRTDLEATPLTPPAPRLETSPQGDLAVIEGRSKARLQGYAWTDRGAGRVRVPIDRAMDLVARQGWPDSPADVAP